MRARIRNFFFPPAGSKRWVRILPYALLGALTLVVLIASAYAWDYTNSPPFCGTVCHTMPPEYTAYLTSPHARVDCVDCHIGRGFIATRITRKAGDLEHVIDTAFHNYEFPIRARKLRPARETCEKCHNPEKFSDDSLRQIKRFGVDKANTPTTTYLVLKTGGGSKRQGLGRGIHWHVENVVEYLPTDAEEQTIPYIRVVEDDGSLTEYVDVSADIDPASIDPAALKEMDCVTCHNRITHLILTPTNMVDQLMTRGLISPEIPEIRRRAVATYAADYATTQAALDGLAGLAGYYQMAYPDYYADHQSTIESAVAALQDAYQKSFFPEQQANWRTHPNNIGHQDSPGCFRCHDGKHLAAQGKAIRLECNLCHSVPVVAGPPDFLAEIELSRGIEPQSHLNTNWIALHRQAFDQTCANCHSVDDPGGTSNTSFCSNSACHGNTWTYAGFDAPALRTSLQALLPSPAEVTYSAVIGPLFEQRCGACHGATASKGLNLTTYAGTLAGSNEGPVIVPGDSLNSRLVQVQSSGHFAQLTPEELALVRAWIDAGAPE